MPNPRTISPLRYPGGKACLSSFIAEIATLNGLNGGTYLELYAGGAGAALNLLFDGVFNSIHINDFDYHIYSMWDSMLNNRDAFITKIKEVDVSITEWHRQQAIYSLGNNADPLDLGFATFFLNRTNRSGIIFKAGPIGGIDQSGNYKINVRFNKEALINRIDKIYKHREQILLTNLDAIEIIRNINIHHPDTTRLFAYLDPPYYHKGKLLYLNNYNHENHEVLAETIANLGEIKWLISYDNVPQIVNMFRNYRMSTFDLNYSLQSKKFGKELLIFSNTLQITNTIKVNNRTNELVLI